MKNGRLVRNVYNMMLRNDNENSLVSKVFLFYCNLQETWQTQRVGNDHQFREVLREILIYFSDQNWIETIQSSRIYLQII